MTEKKSEGDRKKDWIPGSSPRMTKKENNFSVYISRGSFYFDPQRRVTI
jgi:hypothetical protein